MVSSHNLIETIRIESRDHEKIKSFMYRLNICRNYLVSNLQTYRTLVRHTAHLHSYSTVVW